MFGLEDPVLRAAGGHTPQFLRQQHTKLSMARSAFRLLDRMHTPAQVWLPAYLCDVVVDEILPPRSRIRWYPITLDLRIADEAWVDQVEPGDLVVFITYFGFDTWSDLGLRLREFGAIVIEDAAQSLLGRPSAAAHYSVLSPRKFVGVPDGGLLVVHGDATMPGVVSHFDRDAWLKAYQAVRLRRAFDERGGEREWYRLFHEFESVGPPEPSRMSDLSAALLESCIDYDHVSERRRRNYLQLLDALREYAIFDALPEGVVPLGFPVRVSRRDELRQQLFTRNIYPPVHWPVGRVVPRNFQTSHELESVIMTLPCDQRYGEDDMQRMIDCFLDAAKGLSAVPVR